MKSPKLDSGNVTKTAVLAVVGLALIGGWVSLRQSSNKDTNKTPSSKEAPGTSVDNSDLVDKVSRLVVLPQDEEPTIATVTDLEKLKGQAFFSRAKNGDKVLVYTKAKKAYLYDPVANRIIDIAPISANATGSSQPR